MNRWKGAGALAAVAALVAVGALVGGFAWSGEKQVAWNAKATVIEACSCPMFCQCYFNSEPASHMPAAGHAEHEGHEGHGEEHFCRFNMGFKIDDGRYGETSLKDATFWIAGDLGSEFDDGKMEWAVLTFDKATTPAQREGIVAFISTVFPVEWASFRAGEGAVSWKADGGSAHAMLDGGKTAEIRLAATKNAAQKGKPVVIQNLQYWNAKKNHGFVLMPNEVEAWRGDERAFEFSGTNGFMVTIEADSEWAKASLK